LSRTGLRVSPEKELMGEFGGAYYRRRLLGEKRREKGKEGGLGEGKESNPKGGKKENMGGGAPELETLLIMYTTKTSMHRVAFSNQRKKKSKKKAY